MTVDLEKLRAEFPADRIGLLPKPYKRDSAKGNCDECGKYHGLPALHLDYVGHGAVTERLLEVDPEWSWEPVAFDEQGLPAVHRRGTRAVLWIRLTIGGVTRIGVGTCQADKDEAEKELIGDAIRNAAMRFGVALDLWIKGDKAEGVDVEVSRPSVPDHIVEMQTYVGSLVQGDVDLAREYVTQTMKQLGLENPLSPEDCHKIKTALAEKLADEAPF